MASESIDTTEPYYYTKDEMASIIVLAIVTAFITVGALWAMIECFIPDIWRFIKEERRIKSKSKPRASKDIINELNAKKDKKKDKKNKIAAE